MHVVLESQARVNSRMILPVEFAHGETVIFLFVKVSTLSVPLVSSPCFSRFCLTVLKSRFLVFAHSDTVLAFRGFPVRVGVREIRETGTF